MTLPVFGESDICRSRQHCFTCRSRFVLGQKLRAHWATLYSGIGDGIECPHGLPWGWVPPPGTTTAAPIKPKRRTRGPGDVVKVMLAGLGFKATPKGMECRNGTIIKACGCMAFQHKMNEWGYLGCLRHRREIVEWFVGKARECGVEVTSKSVRGLLRAGLKEWMRGRA